MNNLADKAELDLIDLTASLFTETIINTTLNSSVESVVSNSKFIADSDKCSRVESNLPVLVFNFSTTKQL